MTTTVRWRVAMHAPPATPARFQPALLCWQKRSYVKDSSSDEKEASSDEEVLGGKERPEVMPNEEMPDEETTLAEKVLEVKVLEVKVLEKVPNVKVKVGLVVRVPSSVFPDEPPPRHGYWTGRTVATKRGGATDIGIQCDGEDFVFTRPKAEVAGWVWCADC